MKNNLIDIAALQEKRLLAGVDEVGRGPLAGPVIAAAVIIDHDRPILGLKDSKKLTHKRREQFTAEIKEHALAWSLGRAEVHEIDKINILQASLLAMKRAIEALPLAPECVAVDGQYTPDVFYHAYAIIKGDSLISAISAASILAKVERDNEMIEMDQRYPGYGFASHKGYPTKAHMQSLDTLGISDIHRRSFAPVARLLSRQGMK